MSNGAIDEPGVVKDFVGQAVKIDQVWQLLRGSVDQLLRPEHSGRKQSSRLRRVVSEAESQV